MQKQVWNENRAENPDCGKGLELWPKGKKPEAIPVKYILIWNDTFLM